MALKNHALDDRILQAARADFLENGFEAASLRKIASLAGVTVGAIYTRYQTKDSLFYAVVQPLLDRIGTAFSQIRKQYDSEPASLSQMSRSMQAESETILHLLFDDYDRAVLLLCKSTGSSLASFCDTLVEQKIQETLSFFRTQNLPHPEERVLRLLVSGQFHMYVQIIRDGYDLDSAKELMQAAILYHTGGWLALFRSQHQNNQEVKNEI